MTVTPVDAGNRRISYTTEVARPAAELYALIADPHRHAELDGSGTVTRVVKGPHWVKEGDTFTMAMTMFGAPYRITSRVTEVLEGRVVEWRHPLGHRWRWELEPTETGTKVTETWDYSTLPRIVAAGFGPLGFLKRNAEGIRKTLEGLG